MARFVRIGAMGPHLAKSGGKITQDAIANLANVSQGWISKFFAGLGGWRVWRKIITGLIKSSITTSNNFESSLEKLTEDERWIAQEYLSVLVLELEKNPLEVTESVAALALGCGAAEWSRILGAADRNVVAELLGMTLLVVPEWVSVGVREAII